MKLRTLIDNVHGRYEAQVETFGFTANETEQMANFGEPLIEVGGAFSGSVSRPGTNNTVISIGGDGLGATAVPIVQNGSITGATMTNNGSGYTVAPVTFAGDGVGAAASARFGLEGTSIIVGPATGSGYAVNDILTLPGAPGDTPAQYRVTSVDGGGAVEAADLVIRGSYAAPITDFTSWATSGAGINFDASGVPFSWMIAGLVITSPGSGYNVTPLAVSFTLPTATRRLRTDSPFKQIFDLEDDADSDAKAKVWADTVVARCISAKATLMARTSPFEGETVITT